MLSLSCRCPVSPFGKSLVKQADKHVLTLVTHTFGPDPSLSFECSVKVCTATDTSCQIQVSYRIIIIMTIMLIVVISMAPHLTDTGEHTVLYKINKNV